jgi:hypothetical protein
MPCEGAFSGCTSGDSLSTPLEKTQSANGPSAPGVLRYPVVRLATSAMLVDDDTDLPQQPFLTYTHDREPAMS